jgi:hypothetical protein
VVLQVITETSAMYNPSNSAGSSNFDIKQNWWQQVFNVQGASAQVGMPLSAFPVHPIQKLPHVATINHKYIILCMH